MQPRDDSFSQTPPRAISRRRAFGLLASGAAAAGACLADARWIEPNLLSFTRKDVKCPDLPPGLDGLRVALLADFHFRPGDDDTLIRKVAAALRDEKPDIIALAGDFMSGDPSVVGELLACLGKMEATHGIFAVMGNHDGWSGSRASVARDFEKAGVSFLINRNSVLSIKGESLAVAGTDFVWMGEPDPARTLRGIPAGTPVVALVHEPDYFDVMRGHRDITLQLSGHTHGGQCRVPFIGYAPVKVEHGEKYTHGHYSHGASNLFVTRGVGTTGPRIRFACLPELALLTMRSARA